jgi:hypothetical protein
VVPALGVIEETVGVATVDTTAPADAFDVAELLPLELETVIDTFIYLFASFEVNT